MNKNIKQNFNKILNETMAEMQALNQPGLGSNFNISSSQEVPAPGYLSKGHSILPTEENEEEISNLEKNLYLNIKNIVLNSKTKKISKLRQILKLVNDYNKLN